MQENTFDRIRATIVNTSVLPKLTFEDIKPESTMESLHQDSLDGIELIMAFEEEFGIDINDDDAVKIKDVKALVDYINGAAPSPRRPTEQERKDEAWFEEFKGRCVSCERARPSTRKNEMLCDWRKAWNRGLPDRPGGMRDTEPVPKLFGCVYYVRADKARREN
jgi:acyl carrier protein